MPAAAGPGKKRNIVGHSNGVEFKVRLRSSEMQFNLLQPGKSASSKAVQQRVGAS